MSKIIISTKNLQGNQSQISKHIYGHFTEHLGRCIYDGIWVGEDSKIPNTKGIRNDIVDVLKKINIPNIRWPGGCFADEYHWKDGIGSKNKRPMRIVSNWGGVPENNHFGTHEFFDLCELLDCEPYICGNVGSGTVEEMSQWIEYINNDSETTLTNLRKKNGREKPWKIKYWGVGNENWGCGGYMTAEYYSDLFLRYSTYCKDISENKLYKVACGPPGEYPIEFVLNWVETLMKKTTVATFYHDALIHGISLHYYTRMGSMPSVSVNEKKYSLAMKRALYIETLITEICKIMDKYDRSKSIGLIIDEWGTWWGAEKDTDPNLYFQQNTITDALVASLNFDIFNRHCERIHMANIAQLVNVLQSLILTKGDKMILTPTYHVFDLYKVHHDSTLLPMEITTENFQKGRTILPKIHGSASKDIEEKIHISLSNIDPNSNVNIELLFTDLNLEMKQLEAAILRSNKINDHNTFENPEYIKPKKYENSNFKIENNLIKFEIPSKSIMVIEIK